MLFDFDSTEEESEYFDDVEDFKSCGINPDNVESYDGSLVAVDVDRYCLMIEMKNGKTVYCYFYSKEDLENAESFLG